MIATEWQYVFESIAAAGSVLTALALYFVWGQFRQVQQEHVLTFRPFLYNKRIKITEDCSVELHLGNTGRLPAKIIELKEVKKGSPITEEELRSSKGKTENLPTIMPEEGRIYNLHRGEGKDKPPWFDHFGILFKYSYGNNIKGEFGITSTHNRKRNEFIIIDIYFK